MARRKLEPGRNTHGQISAEQISAKLARRESQVGGGGQTKDI